MRTYGYLKAEGLVELSEKIDFINKNNYRIIAVTEAVFGYTSIYTIFYEV